MDRFFNNFFNDDDFHKEFNEMMNRFFDDEDINYDFKSTKPKGDHNVEEGEKDGYKWRKEVWTDNNGSFVSKTYITHTGLDSKPKDNIKLLQSELDKAVEEERYEDAAKLRDKIKSLK